MSSLHLLTHACSAIVVAATTEAYSHLITVKSITYAAYCSHIDDVLELTLLCV
jgi:hypothetical protein